MGSSRWFLRIGLVSCFAILAGCGAAETPLGTDAAGTPYTIGGKIQKGPFLIGSSVTIQELTESLESTGTSFQTTTINDLGHFNTTVAIAAPYVEVITNGFFYDEVSGNFAAAQITLRTISAFTEGEAININLLTQLARDRIKNLVLTGATFPDALAQAQRELLTVFHVSTASEVADFDSLDIAGQGVGNAVLLAISAQLMQAAVTRAGAGSIVAEVSNLLATIGSDIEQDGTLDSPAIRADIRQAGIDLDVAALRANLESRYTALGAALTVAAFEDYVDKDGDGILPVDDDNLPEPFNVGSAAGLNSNALPGAVVYSDAITVTGVTGVARVVLTGGALLKNCATPSTPSGCDVLVPTTDKAGDAGDITVTDVVNGDTLVVKVTSSAVFGETVSPSLKVGDTTETFSVSTFPLVPFTIALTAPPDLLPADLTTSSTFTVSAIPAAYAYQPVSLTSGTLEKSTDNGGTWSAQPKDSGSGVSTTTVRNGDWLRVRLNAASTFSTATSATLTVGATTGTFTITTCSQAICLQDGIFVSTTGSNSNLGTKEQPLQSVSYAIDVAGRLSTKPTVNVEQGAYSVKSDSDIVVTERDGSIRTAPNLLLMQEGLVVRGGWNVGFGARNPVTNTTTITDTVALGGSDTVPNAPVRFAAGVTSATVLDGFAFNAGDGAYSAGMLVTDASPTISANTIFGGKANFARGIRILRTGASAVTPTITGNTINGGLVDDSSVLSVTGIYSSGGAAPAITSNTIRAQSVSPANDATGIRALNSGAASISGNILDAIEGELPGTGISVDGSTASVNIQNNQISGITSSPGSTVGINIIGATANIEGNTIDGGAAQGAAGQAKGINIDLGTGAYTVSVVNNQIKGGSSATDLAAGIYAIGGAGATLNITGNTIRGSVTPGGANYYGVKVQNTSGTTLTIGDNRILGGRGATASAYGIKLDAASATITRNVISGGAAVVSAYGISGDNITNTTISDNAIDGGDAEQENGAAASGIRVHGDSGAVRNFLVERNSIYAGETGFNAISPTNARVYGVEVEGQSATLTATIRNNTIHGGRPLGAGSVAAGIRILLASANIQNNTIRSGSVGASPSRRGITLANIFLRTVNIQNNIIMQGHYCIYEETTGTAADPDSVENNSLSGCTSGLYFNAGVTALTAICAGGTFGTDATTCTSTGGTVSSNTGASPGLLDTTYVNRGIISYTPVLNTIGGKITGQTSGATATVLLKDFPAAGQLTLGNIRGFFLAGEIIDNFAQEGTATAQVGATPTIDDFVSAWKLQDTSDCAVSQGGMTIAGWSSPTDKEGIARPDNPNEDNTAGNSAWSIGAYEKDICPAG